MVITPDTTVADIATSAPATIAVFQQHRIDFCCGGRRPLSDVCEERGIDPDLLVTELVAAATPAAAEPSWAEASLADVIAHIQSRYHDHLRIELPRLSAMVDKVLDRHGAHLRGTLLPLQQAFRALRDDLLTHMVKEERVLFPFITALEARRLPAQAVAEALTGPIAVMEAEHESAGGLLQTMRDLTDGYAPPDWACPTFRGLYYGLAQLETDMHLHVHLENHVLFPRALRLARDAR